MYNPLRYFSGEVMKNLSERSKEIMTFLYPPVTMHDKGGELIVEADMPGFDKKDINVRINKRSLIIDAERDTSVKGTVYLDQRPDKINKVIHLPFETDPDLNFTAKYANGVLTITVPSTGVKAIKVE
jgi:HSP20 family molecular chaperone IbpA